MPPRGSRRVASGNRSSTAAPAPPPQSIPSAKATHEPASSRRSRQSLAPGRNARTAKKQPPSAARSAGKQATPSPPEQNRAPAADVRCERVRQRLDQWHAQQVHWHCAEPTCSLDTAPHIYTGATADFVADAEQHLTSLACRLLPHLTLATSLCFLSVGERGLTPPSTPTVRSAGSDAGGENRFPTAEEAEEEAEAEEAALLKQRSIEAHATSFYHLRGAIAAACALGHRACQVLWGPTGCGKSRLLRLLAEDTRRRCPNTLVLHLDGATLRTEEAALRTVADQLLAFLLSESSAAVREADWSIRTGTFDFGRVFHYPERLEAAAAQNPPNGRVTTAGGRRHRRESEEDVEEEAGEDDPAHPSLIYSTATPQQDSASTSLPFLHAALLLLRQYGVSTVVCIHQVDTFGLWCDQVLYVLAGLLHDAAENNGAGGPAVGGAGAAPAVTPGFVFLLTSAAPDLRHLEKRLSSRLTPEARHLPLLQWTPRRLVRATLQRIREVFQTRVEAHATLREEARHDEEVRDNDDEEEDEEGEETSSGESDTESWEDEGQARAVVGAGTRAVTTRRLDSLLRRVRELAPSLGASPHLLYGRPMSNARSRGSQPQFLQAAYTAPGPSCAAAAAGSSNRSTTAGATHRRAVSSHAGAAAEAPLRDDAPSKGSALAQQHLRACLHRHSLLFAQVMVQLCDAVLDELRHARDLPPVPAMEAARVERRGEAGPTQEPLATQARRDHRQGRGAQKNRTAGEPPSEEVVAAAEPTDASLCLAVALHWQQERRRALRSGVDTTSVDGDEALDSLALAWEAAGDDTAMSATAEAAAMLSRCFSGRLSLITLGRRQRILNEVLLSLRRTTRYHQQQRQRAAAQEGQQQQQEEDEEADNCGDEDAALPGTEVVGGNHKRKRPRARPAASIAAPSLCGGFEDTLLSPFALLRRLLEREFASFTTPRGGLLRSTGAHPDAAAVHLLLHFVSGLAPPPLSYSTPSALASFSKEETFHGRPTPPGVFTCTCFPFLTRDMTLPPVLRKLGARRRSATTKKLWQQQQEKRERFPYHLLPPPPPLLDLGAGAAAVETETKPHPLHPYHHHHQQQQQQHQTTASPPSHVWDPGVTTFSSALRLRQWRCIAGLGSTVAPMAHRTWTSNPTGKRNAAVVPGGPVDRRDDDSGVICMASAPQQLLSAAEWCDIVSEDGHWVELGYGSKEVFLVLCTLTLRYSTLSTTASRVSTENTHIRSSAAAATALAAAASSGSIVRTVEDLLDDLTAPSSTSSAANRSTSRSAGSPRPVERSALRQALYQLQRWRFISITGANEYVRLVGDPRRMRAMVGQLLLQHPTWCEEWLGMDAQEMLQARSLLVTT